ncbi:hypothetical protein EES43_05555 [Streptomyces sp. ADI96-02]|nr:hypothetical protein EES43_05555 [Streptomyces sp. ADI96-02]
MRLLHALREHARAEPFRLQNLEAVNLERSTHVQSLVRDFHTELISAGYLNESPRHHVKARFFFDLANNGLREFLALDGVSGRKTPWAIGGPHAVLQQQDFPCLIAHNSRDTNHEFGVREPQDAPLQRAANQFPHSRNDSLHMHPFDKASTFGACDAGSTYAVRRRSRPASADPPRPFDLSRVSSTGAGVGARSPRGSVQSARGSRATPRGERGSVTACRRQCGRRCCHSGDREHDLGPREVPSLSHRLSRRGMQFGHPSGRNGDGGCVGPGRYATCPVLSCSRSRGYRHRWPWHGRGLWRPCRSARIRRQAEETAAVQTAGRRSSLWCLRASWSGSP